MAEFTDLKCNHDCEGNVITEIIITCKGYLDLHKGKHELEKSLYVMQAIISKTIADY